MTKRTRETMLEARSWSSGRVGPAVSVTTYPTGRYLSVSLTDSKEPDRRTVVKLTKVDAQRLQDLLATFLAGGDPSLG
jgi:hypothetical protein